MLGSDGGSDREEEPIVQGRRPKLLALVLLLTLLTAACSPGAVTTSSVPGAGWVNGSPQLEPGAAAPGPDTPNIVFVLTDDLSWNLVRYMPHVLAMERAGVTFRNYFVTDSLCCPSRTSILTGQFPHNSGVFGNTAPDGGFTAFLAHSDPSRTFAPVLRSRGYQTGLFGKFMNDYGPQRTYDGQRPYIPPGWSAWVTADKHGYGEYGYTLAVGRQLGTYGDAPRDYLTSVLSTKASQFIAASAKAHRPFMAEISTFSPHDPFVPAPADALKFPALRAPQTPAFGRAVRNPPAWLSKIPALTTDVRRRIDRAFRLRVRDVQSVDRMIGRLQDQVANLGLADNTYFVFSSDNGLHLGEHNLRQGKQTAFDTDILVPLVVTGPGVPANRCVTQLAENVDLAPTFETLAGAVPPSTVDGHSLVPLLRGRTPPDWRTAVLVEHHGPNVSEADPDYPLPYSGNPPSYEAIRTARFLYVEYIDGQRELYDLARDPYQLDNRYGAVPEQLESRLHTTLLRMKRCQGAATCWAAEHLAPPRRPPPG